MKTRTFFAMVLVALVAQSGLAQKTVLMVREVSNAEDDNVIAALGSGVVSTPEGFVPGLGYRIVDFDQDVYTQDTFTAADGDLIFISQTCSSGNVNMHNDDLLPVVLTENWLGDDRPAPRSSFYFNTDDPFENTELVGVNITNNTHAITSIFPLGVLRCWEDVGQNPIIGMLTGTMASGATVLASPSSTPTAVSIIVANTNATMLPGAPAGVSPTPARRAIIAFNQRSMNNPTLAGVILLQRTVQWAMGDPITADLNSLLPIKSITRDIQPDLYAIGQPLSVTIDVTWASDSASLTIEETVPAGWVPVNISNGGTASGDVITWDLGTFTASVQVTYEVYPKGGIGTVGLFSGLARDAAAREYPIGGEMQIDRSGAQAQALVAYWPLDDGVGIVATEKINAYDGTLVNGPTWGAGQFGQALTFDGTDDFVNLPTGIVGSSAGSVSCWISTAHDFASSPGMVFHATQTSGDGFGSQYEMHLHVEDGGQAGRIQFFTEGTDTGGADINPISPNAYNDGQWHHVVAVWDRTADAVLYVDGTEVARQSYVGANDFVCVGSVRLGSPQNFNYRRQYTGSIDEVRLYNVALTEGDVTELFTTPPTPPAAPSNLTAALSLGRYVQLAWDDNSDNEYGFVIQRKEGGVASTDPYVDIGQVGAGTTTFLDQETVAGQIYAYRVRAFNEVGESAYSNEVEATIPIALDTKNWHLYR